MIDAALWLTVGVWLWLVYLELISMVRRRSERAADECDVWGDPVGYIKKTKENE